MLLIVCFWDILVCIQWFYLIVSHLFDDIPLVCFSTRWGMYSSYFTYTFTCPLGWILNVQHSIVGGQWHLWNLYYCFPLMVAIMGVVVRQNVLSLTTSYNLLYRISKGILWICWCYWPCVIYYYDYYMFL